MAKQLPERNITRVWRHQTENRAVVEYDAVTDTGASGQMEADKARPPTATFHEAMDAMFGFCATPYGVTGDQAKKVRLRELKLFRKAGDDGEEVVQVKLYGTRTPEGFDADVPFRIPKQEVTGKLKAAVDNVVAVANGYIDGERGQGELGLGDNALQFPMS